MFLLSFAEKNPKELNFGASVKPSTQNLLSIIADADYGDITDLMNGRDIDVEFTPAEGTGSIS
jgi:hypothetical protein